MENIRLSVVIPAYNEVKNLEAGCLSKVEHFLKEQSYRYEVLIVDDGSTDRTAEIIEKEIRNKPGFRLIRNAHSGKAVTVMTGMLQAKGEIAVFTDMDQATPLDQVEKFFPKFEEGADIVIGVRSGRKGAPLVRKLTAWGFSVLRNLILGLPFSDTQCGFKAFTKEAIRKVFPKIFSIWQSHIAKGAATNAGFDVEMLFFAKKQGLKIVEVPVEWQYVPSKRFSFFKDALEGIKVMLRVRLNDLQDKYD